MNYCRAVDNRLPTVHQDEEEDIYCDIHDQLTTPVFGAPRRRTRRRSSRSRRRRDMSGKKCKCNMRCDTMLLSTSLLFTLLGIIITSSYIFDKNKQVNSRIFYGGISITGIGVLLIIVSLVPRLVKSVKKQHVDIDRSRQDSSPIFFIGCNRDTAVAYQPMLMPVPPPPPPYRSTNHHQPRSRPPSYQSRYSDETVSSRPTQPPPYHEAVRNLMTSNSSTPSTSRWTNSRPSIVREQAHHQWRYPIMSTSTHTACCPRQNSSVSGSALGDPIIV